MPNLEISLWQEFLATGSTEKYLKYKNHHRMQAQDPSVAGDAHKAANKAPGRG